MYSYRKVKSKVESELKPCARSGHRAICNFGSLYIIGGYNPLIHGYSWMEDELMDFCLYQELWKFNFATTSWRLRKISIPKEFSSIGSFSFGEKILVRFRFFCVEF